PRSTLFPYTTLSRSLRGKELDGVIDNAAADEIDFESPFRLVHRFDPHVHHQRLEHGFVEFAAKPVLQVANGVEQKPERPHAVIPEWGDSGQVGKLEWRSAE